MMSWTSEDLVGQEEDLKVCPGFGVETCDLPVWSHDVNPTIRPQQSVNHSERVCEFSSRTPPPYQSARSPPLPAPSAAVIAPPPHHARCSPRTSSPTCTPNTQIHRRKIRRFSAREQFYLLAHRLRGLAADGGVRGGGGGTDPLSTHTRAHTHPSAPVWSPQQSGTGPHSTAASWGSSLLRQVGPSS